MHTFLESCSVIPGEMPLWAKLNGFQIQVQFITFCFKHSSDLIHYPFLWTWIGLLQPSGHTLFLSGYIKPTLSSLSFSILNYVNP
jgi:hypothetical protein